MYVLGINSAYHESSACLIKDGIIIAAVEEERFNRVKHAKTARVDNPDELPFNAISFCLEEAGRLEGRKVTLLDIEHIGYSLNPKERLQRNTQHRHQYLITPNDFGTKEGEQLFYKKNLEVLRRLRQNGFKGRLHYLNHHDCHAASSFFVSPFDDAAVLIIDGIGEFESTTLYHGHKNHIERLLTIDYPNSLGFLWEKMSKFFGFTEYDACKVMGMASYGIPRRYHRQFKRLADFGENGNFSIDDKLAMFRNEDYSGLEKIFELTRRTAPIEIVEGDNKKYADLAASLQEVTDGIVVKLAETLNERTNCRNLCLAGGVALNCVTNARIIKSGIFDDIFIQPAAHDAGTAIGAAFYIWNQSFGNKRDFVFESPYLGPSFANEDIMHELNRHGLIYTQNGDIEGAVAQLIVNGNIIAWFQGRMEIGPRALGNRSIIADPRNGNFISEINKKIKHRESFRPFCPSVLEEMVSEWFDVDQIVNPAKYMLATYEVLPDKISIIPAVVHVDGTSRLQTVSQKLNPRFYALINSFYRITGVPMLLNTSFNDQGPIVCTPNDAVNTFLKNNLDYLAISNFLVSKSANKVN